MDAAEEGDVEAVEEAGDGFVGFDHEHFDHGVGEGGAFGLGVDDVSLVVVDEFSFGEFEGEHAIFLAAFLEYFRQLLHFFDEFDDGGIEAGGFAFEDLVDFIVGEAAGGADEAVGEAGFEDFAVLVEFDIGGFGEAVLVLLEGAQVVADVFGEHGDDVLGEVNAGASLVCLFVERGVGGDEGADVGDVDAEEVLVVGQFAEADGVVEVAGIGGVDGDDGVGADVFAEAGVDIFLGVICL